MNNLDEIKKQTYTVHELAKILNVSYLTALKVVKKGDIKMMKVGRQYKIPCAEIEKLLQPSDQMLQGD